MNDKTIREIWQRVNIWQKILIALFLGIWIVLSAWIVLATAGNWILAIGGVFALWLGYVALAFVITRDYSDYGHQSD